MNLSFLPFTPQITMNDHLFCIPSTIYIYCLIFVLPIIIGIIVFASGFTMSSILDSEADFRARQRPRFINVSYVAIPSFKDDHTNTPRNMIFIRDIYDPTGTNLYALLAGKSYETHVHNNYHGYLLTNTGPRLQPDLVGNLRARVPVLHAGIVSVESRGFVITSGTLNTPVAVDTTLTGSKTLLIKEHV